MEKKGIPLAKLPLGHSNIQRWLHIFNENKNFNIFFY